jgi:hypothetical protein
MISEARKSSAGDGAEAPLAASMRAMLPAKENAGWYEEIAPFALCWK